MYPSGLSVRIMNVKHVSCLADEMDNNQKNTTSCQGPRYYLNILTKQWMQLVCKFILWKGRGKIQLASICTVVKFMEGAGATILMLSWPHMHLVFCASRLSLETLDSCSTRVTNRH